MNNEEELLKAIKKQNELMEQLIDLLTTANVNTKDAANQLCDATDILKDVVRKL
jgi:hypothetical protein